MTELPPTWEEVRDQAWAEADPLKFLAVTGLLLLAQRLGKPEQTVYEQMCGLAASSVRMAHMANDVPSTPAE